MTHSSTQTFLSLRTAALGFCAALFCAGCSSAPPPPAAAVPDIKADEAAVRKADMDWAAAAQSKKVDDWVAYYAGDAVVMPPNDAEADSKDTIHKAVGEFLALPDLTLHWEPKDVSVAGSGDVAYSRGTYTQSNKDAKGKTVQDHGKYLEVWKKQSDGTWKCAIDTWNSDVALVPPPKK